MKRKKHHHRQPTQSSTVQAERFLYYKDPKNPQIERKTQVDEGTYLFAFVINAILRGENVSSDKTEKTVELDNNISDQTLYKANAVAAKHLTHLSTTLLEKNREIPLYTATKKDFISLKFTKKEGKLYAKLNVENPPGKWSERNSLFLVFLLREVIESYIVQEPFLMDSKLNISPTLPDMAIDPSKIAYTLQVPGMEPPLKGATLPEKKETNASEKKEQEKNEKTGTPASQPQKTGLENNEEEAKKPKRRSRKHRHRHKGKEVERQETTESPHAPIAPAHAPCKTLAATDSTAVCETIRYGDTLQTPPYPQLARQTFQERFVKKPMQPDNEDLKKREKKDRASSPYWQKQTYVELLNQTSVEEDKGINLGRVIR